MTSPPIVPGPDAPITLAAVLPSPPRQARWVLPVALVAALSVAGAVGAFLWWPRPSPAAPAATVTTTPALPPLRAAYAACSNVGQLSDGDRTLFLDMVASNGGYVSRADVFCVLRQLGTPDYVIHEMEQTRAIDGRQSDTWGDFQASWSYHPDDGLDVLLRQVKG